MKCEIYWWIISTYPGWNKDDTFQIEIWTFISPIQNKKNVKSLQYSVNVNFCLFGNIFHTETDTLTGAPTLPQMETLKKKLKKMKGVENVKMKKKGCSWPKWKLKKLLAKDKGLRKTLKTKLWFKSHRMLLNTSGKRLHKIYEVNWWPHRTK